MAIDHAIQHRAEELAGGLPPLLVAAERVASTVAQGVHGRRRVGQGDSFWQFRPYAAGDAIHRIDWRETAKSDRAFVRETEWEAAQSIWLWNDRSASMAYRSSRNLPTKGERAALLLLALVALLVRGGERTSLLGSGLPPSTGRAVLNRIALMLMRQATADKALEPFPLARKRSSSTFAGRSSAAQARADSISMESALASGQAGRPIALTPAPAGGNNPPLPRSGPARPKFGMCPRSAP